MARAKQSSSDRKIEIVVSVKKRKDVDVTPQFLREAVMFWVDSGGTWPGVKIKSVMWERNNGSRAGARTAEELDAVRENMLRRFLHLAKFNITRESLGHRKRAGAT